jgi:hypothetical protein
MAVPSSELRRILESRLLEIYESLLEIRQRVDKKSNTYKSATMEMAKIEKEVNVKKLRQTEVRIDSSALCLKNGKLSGTVILSDNEKVYELQIEKDQVKSCKSVKGGFKQLEWIVTRFEGKNGEKK